MRNKSPNANLKYYPLGDMFFGGRSGVFTHPGLDSLKDD
jgi:hypothetical protein